jgi:hypothetical protein
MIKRYILWADKSVTSIRDHADLRLYEQVKSQQLAVLGLDSKALCPKALSFEEDSNEHVLFLLGARRIE